MAWRDNLRPASFRGVPFYISATEEEGGRRGTLHEYPGADVPYFEDTGLKGPKHSIEAFVIGADYMAARDQLKKALNQNGPGALVHPYLGTRQVACPNFRLREARSDGGLAKFSIDFVETGRNTQPASAVDTRGRLLDTGGTTMGSLGDSFAEDFSLDGLPDFDVSPLADAVADFSKGFDAELQPFAAGAGLSDDGLAAVRSAGGMLRGVAGDADGLLADPPQLAGQLVDALGQVSGAIGGSRVTDMFIRRAGLVRPAAAITSGGQIAAGALAVFQRRLSLTGAIRAVANESFESRDSAVARLNGLSSAVLREATAAADAGSYAQHVALMDARGAMVEDLTTRSASLRPLMTVEAPAPLPADVMAYHLYGDATRAPEIAVRNGARNPLFIVPGSVQVLTP